MAPTSTKSWILAKKPSDMPVVDGSSADQTFKLETRDLPELKDDQVLIKLLYLSNDPAQRGWISDAIPAERLYVPPVKEGTPMHSRGICEVIESKAQNLKKGDTVVAGIGWNEYAVMDAKSVQPAPPLPNGLAITHYLGALGGTGVTAFYGLKIVGEAKASDRVVVSGAAGATGSMVVQIAKKLVGCKEVIGIAGSDEKCKWVESLGADKCFNYKSKTFYEDMKKATDGFIDLYFDNVGGEQLDFMLTRMARFGRIIACGAISAYNSSQPYGIKNWFEVISMRLQIKGFIVIDDKNIPEHVNELKKAAAEGKLKVGEENQHVVDTKFEDVPKTWVQLFSGGNTGKLVTKIV